jgi:hypothetical protein
VDCSPSTAALSWAKPATSRTSPQTTLEWESLERGYSAFIEWLLNGDVDGFYGDYRWSSWRTDIANLDEAISHYPPLWTKEGKQDGDVSRKAVPAVELMKMQLDVTQRLKRSP